MGANEAADGPLASARSPQASTSRRAVPRHDPRWEPGAVVPLAGICAGGDRQLSSLPRRSSAMSLDGCCEGTAHRNSSP